MSGAGVSFLALLVITATHAGESQGPRLGEIVSVAPNRCSPGPARSPSRTFQLFVFCDDALGTRLGVIHVSLPAGPTAHAWSLDNRFWQSPDWASDATSYAWVSTTELLITTSPVYGTGALHLVDLAARKATRLFPRELGSGNTSGLDLTMKTVDKSHRQVTVQAGARTEVVAF